MNRLIYINGLGPNYKGAHLYEFIFSDTLEVWGAGWDIRPAFDQVSPPDREYIRRVGNLSNPQMELELVQRSDVFGMEDAADNVIALGWEKEGNGRNSRLVFHFGEPENEVNDKLYSRDMVLEFEKEVNYEIN